MEALNKNIKVLTGRQAGQSFFEVVVAMAMVSIVLISLVSLTSVAVRTSVFARNQTEALGLTEQLSEWLNGEKTANWTTFKSHSTAGTVCFSSLNWLTPGACQANNKVSGTIFTRSATFTDNGNNSVTVDIQITWTDAQGTHNA